MTSHGWLRRENNTSAENNSKTLQSWSLTHLFQAKPQKRGFFLNMFAKENSTLQKKTKPARSTTVQVPKGAGGEVPHLNSPKAAAFIQPSEFMEGENKKKNKKSAISTSPSIPKCTISQSSLFRKTVQIHLGMGIFLLVPFSVF